jgi:integrase
MPRKRGKRWTAKVYDASLGYTKDIGTFDTQREAKEAEADFLMRTPQGKETCDEFAARWVTDYPRPRASTNKHNAERVQRFAKDFKGVKLAAITKPQARTWAMEHKGNLGAVRAMFGDAVRDGLITSNPFAELRLPGSKGRKEIRALTERELHELADKALEMELGDYGQHYQAMVLFAGYVGCRPGELFALRRTDIDRELCNIERSLSTTGVGPTKTGKSRTVIVPPPAQDALGNLPIHPSGLLFESPAGKMWRRPAHHYYWRTLRALAGRSDMDFYALRHTAATLLIERGASPWEVAVQLGHTDGGQLVAELYGHPRDEVARERMAALWAPNVAPLRSLSGGSA